MPRRFSDVCHPLCTSAGNRSGIVTEAGRARTTTFSPQGCRATSGRIKCLSRLFTRFRATALPTAFETTNPTSDSGSSLVARACTTTVGFAVRTPRRIVSRKSCDPRIRARCGNTVSQTARCGPCGGGWRESPAQHGSASVCGSRACDCADDCLAERCAWSCRSSSWCEGHLNPALRHSERDAAQGRQGGDSPTIRGAKLQQQTGGYPRVAQTSLRSCVQRTRRRAPVLWVHRYLRRLPQACYRRAAARVFHKTG